MTTRINLVEVGGDDLADCVAHYLLHCGYPTDRPDHLRKVSAGVAAKMMKRHADKAVTPCLT